MKRPKFFEDLDRSLAGEPEPEPAEVSVQMITRQYQNLQAANAETERMAEYAGAMQNMACVRSIASSQMDHWPGNRGGVLDSALGGFVTGLFGVRR